MKSTAIIISLLTISIFSFAQTTDAVKKAENANEAKADKDVVDEDVAEFLVVSAEARMMDAREGNLATKKATTQALRDYGQLMMKEQDILLEKLKALAAKKHVTLPTDLGKKKAEGREDLAEKSGKDFDEKFIKMITIDHERDVKIFKKAMDLDDKEVADFAAKNLPTIQSHLDKINAIKDSMK